MPKKNGFTVIEVLIVIAISTVILAVVFLAFPSLQKNSRDTYRKRYVEQTYAELEQFYSRNGKYPACDSGAGRPCTTIDRDNAIRFISAYMPKGIDPSTGVSYTLSPVTGDLNRAYSDDHTTEYIFNANRVDHNAKPELGKIIIVSGHWCYRSNPDEGDPGNVFAGLDFVTPDLKAGKFGIAIGTEKGDFYCIDNY